MASERRFRFRVRAALKRAAAGWPIVVVACLPEPPPDATEDPVVWEQVAIGASYVCALNSAGGVRCWGHPVISTFEESYRDDLALIPDEQFAEIALWGNGIFCGVTRGGAEDGGELVCRGSDDEALPDGWPRREPAVAVRDDVAIGCYVRPDRRSICFGPWLDRAGLLPGQEIGDITSGGINQCPYALGADGEVETYGECGTPLRPVGPFRAVHWYGSRYCGIDPDEGRLRCGSTGVLPNGEPYADRWTPDLPDWPNLRVVRTDHYFGCAIRDDGTLRCFSGDGPPPQSRLGHGIFEQPMRGRFLPRDTRFTSIDISTYNTELVCGVTESGGVWCGPEGDGTSHYSNVPLDLLPPETVFDPPASEERDD